MAALEGDGGVGCQHMLVLALFLGACSGLAAMVPAALIHALLIETNVKTFYKYSWAEKGFSGATGATWALSVWDLPSVPPRAALHLCKAALWCWARGFMGVCVPTVGPKHPPVLAWVTGAPEMRLAMGRQRFPAWPLLSPCWEGI